jgi:hypothetical protein
MAVEQWSEIADVAPESPAYPAPRRVIDGLASAALSRPVWSVAVERLDPVDTRRIVEIANALGRRVVAVSADVVPWPEGIERVNRQRLAALPSACGAVPADVLHVGTDPELDGTAALTAGIQPVLVGTMGASRHILVVRDVDAFAGVVQGGSTFTSTSTYHEV